MVDDTYKRIQDSKLSEQERLDLIEELARELYIVHGGCTVRIDEDSAIVEDQNGTVVDEVTL